MSTRFYPIYQRGNPQLRIFLPNFWMKLVKPEEPLPPNVVLFETSIEMTKYDVKNYLEKIYKVPVVDVKTEIKMGTIRNCYDKPHLIKDDDYKQALVTLPKGETFEFPNLVPKLALKKEMARLKKMKEEFKTKQAQAQTQHRKGIPTWFQI